MYTYNLFIYGHNLQKNEEMSKKSEILVEADMEFSKVIDNKKYEMSTPYHGGSVFTPILFGHQITDDDGNTLYVNEVRNAKEEDYVEAYNIFLKEYIEYLGDEEEFKEIIHFLSSTAPGFYSLQVSS